MDAAMDQSVGALVHSDPGTQVASLGAQTVLDKLTEVNHIDQSALLDEYDHEEYSHRHPSLGQDAWERIRIPFTHLYHEKGLALKAVMTIMQSRYNFSATTTMYKKRIESWGLSRSWTSEEKNSWGQLAETLIAAGQKLPVADDKGRIIPWDRIRRHYGRDKILVQHLPSRLHRSRRCWISQSDVSVMEHIGQSKPQGLASDLVRILPYESRVQLTLTKSLHQVHHPRFAEERLYHHVFQWYRWCKMHNLANKRCSQDSHRPFAVLMLRSYTLALFLLSWQNPSSQTQALMMIANGIQEVMRYPHSMGLIPLISTWRQLQLHGSIPQLIALSSFMVKSCVEILGTDNPLFDILEELERTSSHLTKTTLEMSEPLDQIRLVEVLIDGISLCWASERNLPSRPEIILAFDLLISHRFVVDLLLKRLSPLGMG